jgi:hypothetical protein
MTVDCTWIEKHLEALSCGTLNSEENEIAQSHLENCGSCAKEVAALNAIDPIVKFHFRRELRRAKQSTPAIPRTIPKRGLAAATSAAVLAASILLLIEMRTQRHATVVPAASVAHEVTPTAVPESIPPVKSTDATGIDRTKPVESNAGDRIESRPAISAPDGNAPEFLVSDPAGYSRTLADYRGHILILGILDARQSEAESNFERLYTAFASNPKLRFLGVFNDRQPRPANTTFPIAYNQGSKLFGAKSGEFLLLDENAAITQRGSLLKDFAALQKVLATN